MNLKDIFTQGQQAQRKYQQTQHIKKVVPTKKQQKLPWYNPLQIIKGAGVLYEMLRPIGKKIKGTFAPAFGVIKHDGQRITSIFKRKPQPPRSPEDLYQEALKNQTIPSQEQEQGLLDDQLVEQIKSDLIAEDPNRLYLIEPQDEWIKSEDRI